VVKLRRFPLISETPDRFDAKLRKLCRNCEEPVSTSRRHYCSAQCMNYYFFNHTWSIVRQDILKRDGLRCSICEKRKPKALLDVDHIIPVRLGVNPYDKRNLRTLCKECHKAKTRFDRLALGR